MRTNDKRHLSIRNKLFAAIAMLLVSSIMMVSSTYAWFTLSTAPEVQGITTTVGANGNLEIALSPYSGDADDITSGIGDSDDAWLLKNLTWGNLLNLSDASYNLGEIKLMPARLNALNNILQPSPLKTPVYGADGRVVSLEETSQIGTKLKLEGTEIVAADSFTVNDYRGVRAIGTSSVMSKYAVTFNNYLSAMGINITNAQNLAKVSLTANGSKLAEMAITHANAGATDNNDYTAYVVNMTSVIDNLKQASNEIESALYAAVVAAGASTMSNDPAAYELLMTQVEAGASLDELLTLVQLGDDNAVMVVYDYWKEDIDAKLTAAENALAGAQAKADAGEAVRWSDASPALNYLLSTNGIKFNGGKDINEFKAIVGIYLDDAPVRADYDSDEEFLAAQQAYDDAMDYMANCITGMQISLGAGSGIYANIAELVGDISASVRIDVIYPGFPVLRGIPVTMNTTSGSIYGATGLLGVARTALRNAGPIDAGNAGESSSVMNDLYAYMVDFLFRTNASGSKLMLQTSAAQRIYEDSTSEATLGHGSTMSFRTGALDAQAVQDLMAAIRVVFLNTDPDNQEIYGYAKLDMSTVRETTITAAVGDTPAVLEYTADLYLYTSADNGLTLNDADKIDEANAELCDLPANTAVAVSAMVYLSGDHVDNSMVANGVDSMVGTLNLQFASSAPLKPMENSALENMTIADDVVDETTESVVDETTESVVDETTESVIDG